MTEAERSVGWLITIGITRHLKSDLLWECWENVLAQTDDRWVAALGIGRPV